MSKRKVVYVTVKDGKPVKSSKKKYESAVDKDGFTTSNYAVCNYRDYPDLEDGLEIEMIIHTDSIEDMELFDDDEFWFEAWKLFDVDLKSPNWDLTSSWD